MSLVLQRLNLKSKWPPLNQPSDTGIESVRPPTLTFSKANIVPELENRRAATPSYKPTVGSLVIQRKRHITYQNLGLPCPRTCNCRSVIYSSHLK
ncbi:unnamed protein product [Soboliphyme baturini]|uniref:Ovule protein n=1 Tax=Soboliphyme baturini TaxID=241478 RepID=A0A183ICS4_9BILA|nr:unnamed protein product [Soboliphyme baturini]